MWGHAVRWAVGLALVAAGWPAGQATARQPTWDVGAYNSIAARSAARIRSAEGRFDQVGGTNLSASGPYNSVPSVPDAFSLQLNSQAFPTALCPASRPACRGWQQFIYSRYQCIGGCLIIEYWLLDYQPGTALPCPTGWSAANSACYLNITSSGTMALTAADLATVRLTATAGIGPNAQDSLTLTKPGETPLTVTAPNVLRLDEHWTDVEWNVVGDCCGHRVDFQATGTVTLLPRVTLVDGTTTKPSCVVPGVSTAETNNLNFGPSDPVPTGTGPALLFMQSSSGVMLANCNAAESVGDTHLQTFDGLLYDFQATGDFVLAQLDGFVVQARQVKVAERWPDASINQAVAVRTGAHRIAVCLADPARVVVDGEPVALRDGQVLQLKDKASLRRRGNAYLVQGPNGHSLRAELNDGWMNVSVGLGQWPVVATGLLASRRDDKAAPGDQGDGGAPRLQRRDGSLLPAVLPFSLLYGRYADDWRVDAKDSLLADCGPEPQRGVPARPFTVADLPAELRDTARAACADAGVKTPGHLEACTLDVAALGKAAAAQVFTRLPEPVAVAQIVADGRRSGLGAGWLAWLIGLLLAVLAAVALWRRRRPSS